MTGPREQAIVFECAGERLVGVLHRPAHDARRSDGFPVGPNSFGQHPVRLKPDPHDLRGDNSGVLIVVGGPQYRAGSHRQFVLMARDLAQAGHPVFRFDYRGMGDSDGAQRTFENVADDIRAAIDAFTAQVPVMGGVVLWGLCDAASACLMYAQDDSRVRAVIVANPWVHTEAGGAKSYLRHYYGQRLLHRSFWLKAAKGELNLMASISDFARKLLQAASGGGAARSPQSFIEQMRRGFENFTGPTLILMSENDLTAQEFRGLCTSNASWARLVARSGVDVVDLDGADHTFSARAALDRATRHCIEWLQQCR